MGVARKLNRWPTTGWKSFFISHSSINGPCVRARQIFSGGCGISRSTTTERVAAAVSGMGPLLEVALGLHTKRLDREGAAFDKLRLRSDFLPLRASLMLSLSKHARRWMQSIAG